MAHTPGLNPRGFGTGSGTADHVASASEGVLQIPKAGPELAGTYGIAFSYRLASPSTVDV
jgi:hypothetical protein